MTAFTLTISMDNAAFTDDPARELARILDCIMTDVQDGDGYGSARDINGNTVGEWKIS